MQMPTFLLLFFAPVYVPLDLLSGWIETVATLNPITYMLEAARSLISGEPELVLAAFALGLALASVLGVWAVRGLRRAEASA
jgi:ABC-2 type transport system permease protein